MQRAATPPHLSTSPSHAHGERSEHEGAPRHRLELCRKELAQLLSQERLAGASLLILANKQDVDGACSADEIVKILDMDQSERFKNRHWSIRACSAVTGEGLDEGMDWMVKDIGDRIFMLG